MPIRTVRAVVAVVAFSSFGLLAACASDPSVNKANQELAKPSQNNTSPTVDGGPDLGMPTNQSPNPSGTAH